MADADFHDAAYYRLQCISEATRNLLLIDPSIVERYSEIPWVRVRAIGNINPARVWRDRELGSLGNDIRKWPSRSRIGCESRARIARTLKRRRPLIDPLLLSCRLLLFASSVRRRRP
jgi:hypothetical protein